ncbi:MAG TPA: DUF1559 domain-containing protein, partial [Gemmataceae bacterium]|nr:DUF1559 domain-containing protein [Gemmataceae bacterium]
APDWRERPVANTIAGATIASYLCPADIADQDVAYVFTLLHTYVDPDTQFPTLRATGSEHRPLGRTNYLGVAGYLGRVNSTYDGIFCNRTKIKITDLTAADGAANTLMFGEVTVGYARFGGGDAEPQAFAYGWMGCGALPTGWGLPRDAQWYTFGSKHEGICYFAFADGAVKALRTGLNNNENLTYIFLSGWHDGSVADWTSLE